MAEYIDKVNALSYLKEKYNEMNGMSAWYYAGFQHAVGLLENFQKSDVSTAVYGKWEKWAGSLLSCSACGHEYLDYLECSNYCPNCGAKMDLE